MTSKNVAIASKPVLLGGDARNLSTLFGDARVNVTITSPPYHDLKDYGSSNQIGYGQTYEEYLQDLKGVFANVHARTVANGSLWIIIDSFRRDKELVPLPFDLAAELRSIGWRLRDTIIWRKERTVPWAKHGDTRGIFEYILLFSKGDNVIKYYADRVRERDELKQWWVKYPERYNPKGKSLENIWTFDIPTQGSWGDGSLRHYCPLPSGLVRRILDLTTDAGDTVLDPFAGTGSVLLEAYLKQRRSIGVELNKKYIQAFNKRLGREIAPSNLPATLPSSFKEKAFSKLIVSLRLLKFARVLRTRLPKSHQTTVKFIIVERQHQQTTAVQKIARAKYTIFAPKTKDSARLVKVAMRVASRPPLSKFGIQAEFRVLRSSAPLQFINGRAMYVYSGTNTHSHLGQATRDKLPSTFRILSSIGVKLNERDYSDRPN